ncbi:hypothetical protein ACFX12_030139 [Malus domestica]
MSRRRAGPVIKLESLTSIVPSMSRRRAGQVIKLESQEGVDPRVVQQKELNRKYVSFSKRRYGLFSKASEFCLKFDAQIAVLVLSPAGRPYSFGHSSVDAVLNRYFKIAQAPSTSRVTEDDQEEQKDKIQVLRKQLESHKKRKREEEIAEKNKVAKVKESVEKELQTCKTVEELVAFKQKYSVLHENINKRLKKSQSPISKRQCINRDIVLEDNNAQHVSIRPILISKDTLPKTTLTTVGDDHDVGNGNSNDNGNGKGSFSWNAEDLENFLLRQDVEDIGGVVDETGYAAMLNYFIGEDGNDPNGAVDVSPAEHVVFPPALKAPPFDPVGSSDFTQHNISDDAANRYYGYFEDIINNSYSHQDTSFNFN